MSNPLIEVQQYGQSIWYDYISRDLLLSGDLRRMVETEGVRGVTSNPAIFDPRNLVDLDPSPFKVEGGVFEFARLLVEAGAPRVDLRRDPDRTVPTPQAGRTLALPLARKSAAPERVEPEPDRWRPERPSLERPTPRSRTRKRTLSPCWQTSATARSTPSRPPPSKIAARERPRMPSPSSSKRSSKAGFT